MRYEKDCELVMGRRWESSALAVRHPSQLSHSYATHPRPLKLWRSNTLLQPPFQEEIACRERESLESDFTLTHHRKGLLIDRLLNRPVDWPDALAIN